MGVLESEWVYWRVSVMESELVYWRVSGCTGE